MDDSPRTGNPNCPQCENPVSDHEPGVSSVIEDGEYYHPSCAPKLAARAQYLTDVASARANDSAGKYGTHHR